MSEDAATRAQLGPDATLALLRCAWRELPAGPPPETELRAVDAPCGAGAAAAWPAVARARWHEGPSAAVAARLPGLRTRLWTAGYGGVLPAVSALVAQAVREGQEVAAGVGCADGHLWIPDPLFRPFVYALELDARGRGVAWAQVPDAPTGHEDPGGVWQAWVRWVTGGAGTRRAWTATPRWLGCLPATGLPLPAPRVAALAEALRALPAPAPLLVLPERPQLLAWWRAGDAWAWPVVGTAAGAGEPVAGAVVGSGRRDLHGALARARAHRGATDPRRTLVRLLGEAVLHLASLGEPAPGGGVRLPLPGHGPWGWCRCGRSEERLAVDAAGLAGVISWLGWFPACYRMDAQLPTRWAWAALEAAGWAELQAHAAWEVGSVGGSAGPATASWIRFPLAAPTLPVLTGGWQALPLPPTPAGCVPPWWNPAA